MREDQIVDSLQLRTSRLRSCDRPLTCMSIPYRSAVDPAPLRATCSRGAVNTAGRVTIPSLSPTAGAPAWRVRPAPLPVTEGQYSQRGSCSDPHTVPIALAAYLSLLQRRRPP